MILDHRGLDPRAKLALLVAVSVLAVALPRLDALLALGVVLTAVVAAGRGLSIGAWAGLLAPFKLLIPVILVLNAFFYGGGTVLWSVDVLGWALRLTVGGVEASLVIAARLLVIAAAAAWFAATTDAEALEVALARLGVPPSLAFVGSLTVRLVPELRARYRTVEDAQRSRGLTVEGGPVRRVRSRIPVLFPFLVAVIRYGYDLGDALRVRGYGRTDRRTYQLTLAFTRTDAAFALGAAAVLVGFAAAFLGGG